MLDLPEAVLEMKERTVDGFCERLCQIRKARGLTQAELGKTVGVSNRVISYYEREGAQPPGSILTDLARALRVSIDELLGRAAVREKGDPRRARLLKRLMRVEQLPKRDQQTVFKIVDGLLAKRSASGDNSRRKTKEAV